MKVILEFDSHENSEELEAALNGGKYKAQLDDLWSRLFRPYRKHGYSHRKLQECIEANPEVADTIIEALIEIYQEVANE
jgi:hypothetical protein